ncbi:MAG: sel1 repeat family protein [Deltaproteobacteria bacterium]|jgi:TPR repeat protein|nr:sel1 repeat family protein [Deltaproteobacteria bacterium]
MGLTLDARRPMAARLFRFALLTGLVFCLARPAATLSAQEGGRDINPAFIEELRGLADGGDTEAAFALGSILFLGHEAAGQDVAGGIAYLEKAAAKNHMMAMSFLGDISENGSGVPRDLRKAVRYFTRAADKGDSEAALALGRLYFLGSGDVKADKKKAFKYYSQAAAKNLPEAQLMLGGMYEAGEGTAKDNAKSWQYLQMAADNPGDDGRGALAAGDVYVSGRNPEVPQDFEKGRQYYRRAAALKVPEASERLALLDQAGTTGTSK